MEFVMIDGESWRVLADVCDVLGDSNPAARMRMGIKNTLGRRSGRSFPYPTHARVLLA